MEHNLPKALKQKHEYVERLFLSAAKYFEIENDLEMHEDKASDME